VYGFQGMGPNGYEDWFESIEEMAATYIQSIVKINPHGRYCRILIGGIVAFEIATIKEQGKSKYNCVRLYVDSSYYYSLLQKKFARLKDRSYRRLDYLFQMLTSWKACDLKRKKVYLQQKYFGLEIVMRTRGRCTCEIYRS
jgi:hypothetical protein